MPCSREHIECAELGRRISTLREQGAVACRSRAVAGDHDDALRLHFFYRFHNVRIDSLSRRIEDDNIGTHAALFEHERRLSGIRAEKLRIIYSVFCGVFACVLNRLRYYFGTVKLPHLVREKKTYRARTAVKVQQGFISRERRKLSGKRIESLCSVSVT